jgi:1-acyl-sn-glycerol-3-phosphate acyltransferase
MKFLKIITVFSLFILFFIISFFIHILCFNENFRLSIKIKNTHLFSRLFLKLCGVTVYHKELDKRIARASLIVSNHLSYLDMVLISSIIPVVFVASVEVKETPILGLFARCSGTIFIERRKITSLKSEIKQIKHYLSRGFTILIFPEGTTSRGDTVLPFKSSLFNAVIDENIIIENLCIKYISIDNTLIDENNRDFIFYYGDMTFWTHFIKLLGIKKLYVEIYRAGILNSKNFSSRKELVSFSHKLITEKY